MFERAIMDRGCSVARIDIDRARAPRLRLTVREYAVFEDDWTVHKDLKGTCARLQQVATADKLNVGEGEIAKGVRVESETTRALTINKRRASRLVCSLTTGKANER